MCRFHVMFIFAVLAVPLYAARVVWNRAFLDLEKPYYDTYDMIATIGSPYLTMGMNYQGEAMVLSAMPDANVPGITTVLSGFSSSSLRSSGAI